MKFYHNPRCQKSRQALELLKKSVKTDDIEVIEYLKSPISTEELNNIIKFLGIEPIELVRKNEAVYKENYKGVELSNEDWIEALSKNPKLIERPILVNGDKAIIGRPPENILNII